MDEVERLIEANRSHVPKAGIDDPRPSRRIAVVTCMDARIDVLAALGLQLGEAHVIRNAGARVTDDVLRSLAVSSNVLGVDAVVVMQHTNCGLAQRSEEELRQMTGAELDFLSIDDHTRALQDDIDALSKAPFLKTVGQIVSLLYDIDSGKVSEIGRWEREQRDD